MKPIYLVGFMGSGKSKLGKALAKKLNFDFLDTDAIIEKRQNCSIAAIFDAKGEHYFRSLESELIEGQKACRNVVIATGGGLPCHANLMKLMNSNGLTIYLDLQAKELVNRLQNAKDQAKRPLIAHLSKEDLLQFVEEKLEERRSIYEQAQLIFQPTKHTLEELIQVVLHHERNS